MEFEKTHLNILKLLNDIGANTPGKGLTLKEIYSKLNENGVFNGAQVTIRKKARQLRDNGYIVSKMKSNKADMFYIVPKGNEMLEILFTEG